MKPERRGDPVAYVLDCRASLATTSSDCFGTTMPRNDGWGVGREQS